MLYCNWPLHLYSCLYPMLHNPLDLNIFNQNPITLQIWTIHCFMPKYVKHTLLQYITNQRNRKTIVSVVVSRKKKIKKVCHWPGLWQITKKLVIEALKFQVEYICFFWLFINT